jgi:hypothetical protein
LLEHGEGPCGLGVAFSADPPRLGVGVGEEFVALDVGGGLDLGRLFLAFGPETFDLLAALGAHAVEDLLGNAFGQAVRDPGEWTSMPWARASVGRPRGSRPRWYQRDRRGWRR